MSQSDTTEITLIDEPVERKSGARMAPNLQIEELKDKLRDQADFLSMFTQRVKQQLQARNDETTVNVPNKSQRSGAFDDQASSSVRNEEQGETSSRREGVNRNIVIGGPSLADVLPGVQQGQITALNTDQFTYYSFFERINQQVYQRWVRNLRNFQAGLTQRDYVELSQRPRTTQVEFVLNTRGEIVQTILQRSAGFRGLDDSAVLAFQDAAPFENPPRGMIESDGYIHLRYHLTLTFSPNPFVGP